MQILSMFALSAILLLEAFASAPEPKTSVKEGRSSETSRRAGNEVLPPAPKKKRDTVAGAAPIDKVVEEEKSEKSEESKADEKKKPVEAEEKKKHVEKSKVGKDKPEDKKKAAEKKGDEEESAKDEDKLPKPAFQFAEKSEAIKVVEDIQKLFAAAVGDAPLAIDSKLEKVLNSMIVKTSVSVSGDLTSELRYFPLNNATLAPKKPEGEEKKEGEKKEGEKKDGEKKDEKKEGEKKKDEKKKDEKKKPDAKIVKYIVNKFQSQYDAVERAAVEAKKKVELVIVVEDNETTEADKYSPYQLAIVDTVKNVIAKDIKKSKGVHLVRLVFLQAQGRTDYVIKGEEKDATAVTIADKNAEIFTLESSDNIMSCFFLGQPAGAFRFPAVLIEKTSFLQSVFQAKAKLSPRGKFVPEEDGKSWTDFASGLKLTKDEVTEIPKTSGWSMKKIFFIVAIVAVIAIAAALLYFVFFRKGKSAYDN